MHIAKNRSLYNPDAVTALKGCKAKYRKLPTLTGDDVTDDEGDEGDEGGDHATMAINGASD